MRICFSSSWSPGRSPSAARPCPWSSRECSGRRRTRTREELRQWRGSSCGSPRSHGWEMRRDAAELIGEVGRVEAWQRRRPARFQTEFTRLGGLLGLGRPANTEEWTGSRPTLISSLVTRHVGSSPTKELHSTLLKLIFCLTNIFRTLPLSRIYVISWIYYIKHLIKS